MFALAAVALLVAASGVYQGFKLSRWFREDSPAARGDSGDDDGRPHP